MRSRTFICDVFHWEMILLLWNTSQVSRPSTAMFCAQFWWVPAMRADSLRDRRLLALTPTDWLLLLGGVVLCGLVLTLAFW